MTTPHINRSSIVRASDFKQPWFVDRAASLATDIRLHRKLWEFCVIAQVYHERVGSGGKALGFGVGKEPLVSWLAGRGCHVIATDLPSDTTGEWSETGQHSQCKVDLFKSEICSKEDFDRLVTFRPVDMNDIPSDLLNGEFDFVWSCGSFEHIGGIRKSIEFFIRQMQCLKPGGVAVHTTEYNFTSNNETLNAANLAILRRRDLELLQSMLTKNGYNLLDLDLQSGDTEQDNYVDSEPYREDLHLKLTVGGFNTTSVVLVAEKPKQFRKIVPVSSSMKVLFVGDSPTVPTGFSRCTEAICKSLTDAGHDVSLLGLHYYGDPHSLPYTIYPCQHPLDNCRQFDGSDRLPKLMHRLRPDVVVILQDPWNIKGYETEIAKYDKDLEQAGLPSICNIPVVGWLAVDGVNQPGDELNNLSHVVVWTKFAAKELVDRGYKSAPSIVPLGVDSDIFYSQDKLQSRNEIIPPKIPRDSFIVGVVGRNQLRKRLDLTIQYFAHWIQSQSIDDAYLYLHVAPTGESGVDVVRICRYYGLADKVMMPQLQVGKGLDNNQLRSTYNSFDVLLTTSQGEGWGLPVIEAMACGVPCVVPDWSALGCWPGDTVITVPCTSTAPTAPLNRRSYTLGGVPDRHCTVDALDKLYRDSRRRSQLARKGRQLVSTLTWNNTGQMMVEILQSVVDSSNSDSNNIQLQSRVSVSNG